MASGAAWTVQTSPKARNKGEILIRWTRTYEWQSDPGKQSPSNHLLKPLRVKALHALIAHHDEGNTARSETLEFLPSISRAFHVAFLIMHASLAEIPLGGDTRRATS